jgi:uncharacterized membrane protein
MQYLSELRDVALLLLLGIGFFCSAAFLANPFQQADAVAFYRAIHKHRVRYWRMNLLHTVAILALVTGFGMLARQTWQANEPLTVLGLVLLIIATLLWLVQFWMRLTATMRVAHQVFTGVKPPATFPHNIGVGFDRLFLAFQICLLVGMAAVLAGLGDAGMISPLMTRLGIIVLIASGVYTTREYPWLGGVERVLFYPMTSVTVPLGIWFLMNSG